MEEKIKNINNLTIDELNTLAKDIRKFLIEKISKNGGHLASNLGVVELTLALFRVFDFKKDKIIFDVGHQSYVYKMLTERLHDFSKLRKFNGLRGFPSIFESDYDYFDTGHSSTSLSAGIGYARSRDLKGEDYNVISLIGDASICNGMAQEAINDIGFRKTKMLIILNDNGMSINKNVGSLSSYFSKFSLNRKYLNVKKEIKKIHNKKIYAFLKWIKDGIRNFLVPNEYFEELGLTYVGPINGHDIEELIKVLAKTKNVDKPVLLHVITKKGLGYEKSMNNPSLYHGVAPFNVELGVIKKNGNGYGNIAGDYLLKLAKKDKSIVAITAAMTDGVGLSNYAKELPNRFFDVGIAEEHATTFAAGLAVNRMKPYLFLYSTFLQRSFDQLIHDICMMKLPVKIMIDRGGIVGEDGQTHHGVFDLSYLSIMPNMNVVSPKCVKEIPLFIDFMNNFDEPIAIRYPKGSDELLLPPIKKITIGKWEIVKKSYQKLAIIATGKMVQKVMKVVEEKKLDVEVINACFIKPLDEKMLDRLTKERKNIITIEDNIVTGGLGSNILFYLNQINYTNKIKILGFKDEFIPQGSINELYQEYHLDEESIYQEINNILKK